MIIFNRKKIAVSLCVCMFYCIFPQDVSAQVLTGFATPAPMPVKTEDKKWDDSDSLFQENLAEESTFRLTELDRINTIAESQISQPPAQPSQTSEQGDAVDLQADRLQHDEQSQVITASGNVMLVQTGRILRADQIQYDLNTDTVEASGHVVLNETNGDIHYAESVVLNDNLKNGFVRGLKTYLADGSRFESEEGERTNGVKTIMKDALFTPCEPCKENPQAAPMWQIKAAEVTHDTEEKRISYDHARFEVFGVPIAYTPYFSHPDGTVKQKSGFLAPSFGYKSDLGAFAGTEYYWAIAPDQDLTVGLTAFTSETPLGEAEYRKRWNNAEMSLNGGLTYSERSGQRNGIDITEDAETRGYVFADGIWDINDKWRSGLNIEWTSDDQFLRQYDITSEDVLENELYLERFSGRDYVVGRFLSFQDLRVDEEPIDQPEILPEIQASFIGEPGSFPLVGGRWSAGGEILSLARSGGDQDVLRLSLDAGWHKRFVSDYGFLFTGDVSARTDVFDVNDRELADIERGRSSDSSVARFFPQANFNASYPLTRDFVDGYQAIIEPRVALTLAPDISSDDDIPNEDSQDVQLDTSNLFEADRFPGRDLVEDQSRLTYGLRTGLYGYEGSYLDVFAGQSLRFKEKNNPFPNGSGLTEQESDFVGEITGSLIGNYNMTYRFQLDGNNLSAQRHEVDADLRINRFSLNSRYLFAKALEGTEVDESREQLDTNIGYYLDPSWRVRTGSRQDFGEDDGLRRAYLGLDYFGQCLSWSVTGVRNLTRDISGDSSTSILFRIGLKNLGDFQESGFRVERGDK